MSSSSLAPFDRFLVAERLRETSDLLELRGGVPYQARAYAKAAAAIESVPEGRLQSLVSEGRLTELPGVGASIARMIEELATRGTTRLLDELRAEFPPGVVELAQVPGLGVQKARVLAQTLGVRDVDDLERACVAGLVRGVKGFGPATEAKILKGIGELRERPNRVLLREARELADGLRRHVERAGGVTRVAIAGDVRRQTETTDEVCVLLETDDAAAVLQHVASWAPLARIEDTSPARVVGRVATGVRVRVETAPPGLFGIGWVRATGAEAHLQALEARARERGVDLDRARHASEEEVYRALGLAFIPPEMREGAGEIEEASSRTSFRLLEEPDLRGIVHCHTTFSDGRDTVEAMALKAEAMGASYLTITDHSPTAHYAGGVTLDRLKEQWDEIARVQELVSVQLLRGTESDILADGSLDYPDEVLEQFDVVIASIHSRMKMDRAEMTRRLCACMRQPLFKIWGHPLGRLLLRREPVDCDVEQILDVAAESKVAIEINGDPHRLDLEPRWIRAAHARGIPFVVSTDAHSTRGLETVELGVAMARRGGLGPRDVLNTADVETFRTRVRPVG